MTLARAILNGAPVYNSPKPVGEAQLFVSDLADFVAAGHKNIRIADEYSDVDYGDKVNSAIDDLGSRGGIVIMRPGEETEFASTIGVTNGIQLVGTRVPCIMSPGSDPRDAGTWLTYTGTGHAINVGAVENNWGNAFRNFLLKCSNASCITGIFFAGQNYNSQFVNLELHGMGDDTNTVGINIPYYSTTSSWQTGYQCVIRKFGVGLKMENINATAWYGLSAMSNGIGVQTIGGVSQNFIGGVIEKNEIGFDLLSHVVKIDGVYYESAAESSTSRFVVAGDDDEGHCRGITLINPYINAGSADHSIVLKRAADFLLIGGYANNNAVSVINNQTAGAAYNNYRVIGFRSDDAIWDDTTRVEETIDTNRKTLYPNMPVADPEVDGQLWSDSGIVTVSAGPV